MDMLLLSNVSVFWLTCHNNLWHHSLTAYHCFTWNVRVCLQSHIGIIFQNKSVGETSVSIDVSAYVCIRRQTHRSKISACESLELQSQRMKQHKMGYFSWDGIFLLSCTLFLSFVENSFYAVTTNDAPSVEWYRVAEKWTACLNGLCIRYRKGTTPVLDRFIYLLCAVSMTHNPFNKSN